MKTQLLTGMVCTLAASVLMADDNLNSVRYDRADHDRTRVAEHESNRRWMSYDANTFDVSVFGTGTVGRKTLEKPSARRVERDGKLGLGVGVSYFVLRYLGVEGYAYSGNTSDHFVDHVGGDLIARLPLWESGVAVYGLAGGGRQFDPVIQWTLDAGGGLEWRFLRHFGIFVDARYVWADKTPDYGLGRVGVKVGF